MRWARPSARLGAVIAFMLGSAVAALPGTCSSGSPMPSITAWTSDETNALYIQWHGNPIPPELEPLTIISAPEELVLYPVQLCTFQ